MFTQSTNYFYDNRFSSMIMSHLRKYDILHNILLIYIYIEFIYNNNYNNDTTSNNTLFNLCVRLLCVISENSFEIYIFNIFFNDFVQFKKILHDIIHYWYYNYLLFNALNVVDHVLFISRPLLKMFVRYLIRLRYLPSNFIRQCSFKPR